MQNNLRNITFMSFFTGSLFLSPSFLGSITALQAQTELATTTTTNNKVSDFQAPDTGSPDTSTVRDAGGAQAWQPPDGVGSTGPSTRRAGGGRGETPASTCDAELKALVPSVIEGRVGVESPALVVYVGKEGSEGETAQLKLTYYDEDWTEVIVFQKMLEDFPRDRLFTIPLPTDLVLEKNRVYHWQFALQCDLERYVRGAISIEPQEISEEILKQLATAIPIDKARIYMNQGWWYDSVKVLLEIQEQDPENLEAIKLWTELLTAEGWQHRL